MGSTRERSWELGLGCPRAGWVLPGKPGTNTDQAPSPSEILGIQRFTPETRFHALRSSHQNVLYHSLSEGVSSPSWEECGSSRLRLQDSWCGLSGARVTLDSGHSDTGSSLWWFSGTLDNTRETSSFPAAQTAPQTKGSRALLVGAWLRTGPGSGGRAMREAGHPLPLRVHLDPAYQTLPCVPGHHFLALCRPDGSLQPCSWAKAPRTLTKAGSGRTLQAGAGPQGWESGWSCLVERRPGTASWAPTPGVCLVPFALSDSHFCGCFLDEVFLCCSLPDGHRKRAVRVWVESGSSPSVVEFWGTDGVAEAVLS
ncbi:uncharacterized protein LOC122903299 isoform X2 [Neovison vison]|uniref:uncharacterized protein LOC122903299 isoform X2 n=1 Tax=Neovison vison TaxID=452646 RepID=UPI001CEFB5A2|nr:uncharacterized protein LOC122903299 isoform X2 [Neogale vison]